METHADEGHVMDDVMTDGEQNERPAIPASDMTSRTFLESLQSLDPETLRQRLLDMHDTLTKLEAEKRQLEEQLTQRSVQNNDDEEQQPPPSDQEKKKATGERSRKISDVFFGDIQPGRSRFHYPGLAVHRSSLSTTPSSYQSANSYRSDSRASISGSIGGGLGAGSASGSGQVRSLTKRLSDGMLNFSGVGAGASSSSQRGLQFYGRKPSWVDERGFYTPKPPVDIVVTVSDTGYSPADEQHSAPPPLYGADAGRRQRKMAVPPYSDGYSGSNLFPTSQYNLSDKRYSESVIRPTANKRYGGRGSTDNGIGAQIPKMNMAKRLSEGVLNLTGAKMRSSPRGSQDHTKLIPSESLSLETSGTPPLADITPQIIQYRESGIKVSEEDTKVQLTTPAVEPKPKKRKFKLKRKKESLSDLKKELSVDEHKIALNELQQRLDTDLEKGLTDLQAEERLLNDGLNALTPLKDKPEIVKFLEQLFTGFNLLLWVGAVLSFIVYALQYLDPNNHPDPSDIVVGVSEIVVVLITGGLGYHQQATSSRIMESFLHMIPQYALVVRGGERKNVPAEELVVGDIVEVKFGDRAPADLRVLSSQSLKVDNSSLTGESEPQSRGPDFTNENPLETKNLIFFSTNVVEGFAKGVVINTGDRTVMGRIANLTSSMSSSETPIARELSRLVKIIVVIAVAMGVIFIAIIIGEGYDPVTAIIFLVGIIMGNVPEGLLATVTVILTLSAKRMARKNCLVKNLESVETLGSTSVICSDKTGTLTQNRMTVAHMWFDNEIFEAETSDAQQEFSAQHRYIVPSWVALSRVAMLCNRAEFKNGQSHLPIMKRECNGDASETAILKCCELTCGDVMAYRLKNTKVCEIPFNSVNKYQLSIHEVTMPDGDLYNLLVMKGAPERIIEKCQTIAIDGEDVVLTEEWITAYKKAYEDLGSLGERVLGFADLLLPKSNFPIGYPFDVDEENFPLDGLRFVGLMSMIDPPRPAVPDAVRKCRSAGIKVIMVTGDHPVTAKAIAKAVGIISEGAETVEDIAARRNIPVELVDTSEAKAIVVHGGQLKNMSDSELRKVLSSYSEIVFARTSPQQKLIIVEGCQNLGNIVAVTGDGVNDSPALKKSDIGVAMGITGSDVSKQSADMVLMDDNFASIVCGVEEGRLVFDNLRKTVCYTVTHTLPELFPFLLYLILNIPLATGTIALLFIDIITDIIPAVNLAYEKPESDIMNRKPRDQKKDRLVDAKLLGLTCGQNGVIESMGGMFVYCVILATNGFLPDMLVGLRAQWENVACNNLADSYGQEWTYAQRKMIEFSSYTAYFVAVCVIQWFNLLICKTLRSSIVEQGMYNHYLHVAVCIETFFVILVSFIPRLDYAFLMATMDWTWFFAPLPFGLLLLIYNEGRKLVCRYLPEGSWAHRELLL